MADGDSKKPLPPPLDESGGGALDSLFGGLHDDRERHAVAHHAGQLGERMHPSRARAARAGVPIGRMVPASDFDARKRRRIEGVPGLIAPPRQVQDGNAPPVQQMRQLTGLPVNNRSNTLTNVIIAAMAAQALPILQFNGQVDDTDMLTLLLGIREHTPQPVGQVGFDSRIIADIQWGVGNAFYSAQVDWGVGTMLTLPANFLSVTALIPDNLSVMAAPTYDLSAGVAYGSVSGHMNRARLTKLTTPGTLIHGSGNTGSVRIPPFAIGYSLSVSQTTGGTFPLLFPGPIDIQQTDTAAGAGPVVFTNNRVSNFTNLGWQESNTFPITSGARFLVMTNTDAANDAIVRVNFDIAI